MFFDYKLMLSHEFLYFKRLINKNLKKPQKRITFATQF